MAKTIVLSVALGLTCVAAQAASFTGLGHLAGGPTYSSAYDVSADGSVVVGQADSTAGYQAFRWSSSGGMAGLGFLGTGSGGSIFSSASAVSANGNIVVGQSSTGSTTAGGAFRWTSSGGMVSLGQITGDYFDSASDISADGTVVVGGGFSVAEGQFTGVRWTIGGMVSLGSPYPDTSTSAEAVSANGAAVAALTFTESGQEASRWTPGTGMESLTTVYSGATGTSADGSVVVGYFDSANGSEAFRWTSIGGVVGLGDLPGGVFDSAANDVSGNGSVVVGYGQDDLGTQAFVWTPVNGMRSLRDVLIANGAVGLEAWTLREATAVSSDGKWIVGYGQNPDGDTEAFLANIDPLSDGDGDGVPDVADNCTLVANASQLDSDEDGYGNICDADLNNSGLTTSADFSLLRSVLNQSAASSALAAAADLNGSGLVTSADFNLLRARLNAAPGPSALNP